MQLQKVEPASRRKFLRFAAAAASGALIAGTRTARGGAAEPMKIDSPFHGAVLNRRTGQEVDGGLKIQVEGEAPLRDAVSVSGARAARAGTRFKSEVVLRERETEIVAVS
jgi:hypothetical protein